MDCLGWSMGSSWWEWSVGSRCFFLRWSREFRNGIRDGLKQWQVGPWPRSLQPHRVESDEKVAEKECIKLSKVRTRRYFMIGEFKILTHYFLVPKG